MREFNKLVRDGIVEEIKGEGRIVTYVPLKGKELEDAFMNKIEEECQEVINYRDEDNLVEELGDLLDVIESFIRLKDLKDDVKDAREKKLKKYGTYDKGIKLHKATEKDED